MARNQEVVSCSAGQWTQLTNADATEITFQVLAGEAYIRYTADATTPSEELGFAAGTRDGPLQATVSELTYLSGAVRVWAKPVGQSALIIVDHA